MKYARLEESAVAESKLEAALEREKERLRALQEIGTALGSTLDLDEILGLVLTRISNVVDAERSTLYLLDEDTGELWSKLILGEHIDEIRLQIGEGLAGWVARNGEAVNIDNAYRDARFDPDWDRRTGYRTTSTLCVPMKNHHGRTIGVVQVLNKKGGGVFSKEDEQLLLALSAQAAVSIENSRLFLSLVGKNMELLDTKEQLERKVHELDVLFEIAQVAAHADRLDDLLEGVLERSMRAIDAEACSILVADEGGRGDLRFRCAGPTAHNPVRRISVPADQGIVGWVAMHGEPQVIHRAESDPRFSPELAERLNYRPRSLVAVPLSWEGGTGALELLNKAQGRDDFTEDDVKLATVIAGHVSTAIGLARARERREREERLSTIGQLLSGVLHDLKTPITVISGYVQLLMDEADADVRESYGQTILKQVELINAMTKETLAFARGDRSLWVRKVYLHKFFEEVEEQLTREFEGRNIEFRLELNDRGVAHFDQHKIQRAIHNLVRNAREAIGSRGGTIVIHVDRRAEDNALVLSFEDDGPGVPDEIRGRLFDSFISHGKKGGSGLGLAIVRKIVDDHGGTIDVTTRPGKTVFTIVLPQPEDTSSSSRPPPAPATDDDKQRPPAVH